MEEAGALVAKGIAPALGIWRCFSLKYNIYVYIGAVVLKYIVFYGCSVGAGGG